MEVLRNGIYQYAKQQRDREPIKHFGLFMRDDNNQIIGGCNGYVGYG